MDIELTTEGIEKYSKEEIKGVIEKLDTLIKKIKNNHQKTKTMKTKKEKTVLTEEEKTSNKKKFHFWSWLMALVFLAILLAVISITFASCEKLDIKQDFDFEIEMLPYHSENIAAHQSVEMRFNIATDSGSYEGTKYFMRYFQNSGTGQLISEDGEFFRENDDYELTDKSFRLYYTPSVGTTHSLLLTFFDSFGHEKEINVSISMQTESK